MIPKIIWQTHEWEYKDLPEHLKKNTRTWINLNPGWEYKYMSSKDRADMMKEHDHFYNVLFRNDLVCKYCRVVCERHMKPFKMHQADIWRYYVVNKFGGVYVDMDSVCIQPLDYMLELATDKYEMIVTEDEDDIFCYVHGFIDNCENKKYNNNAMFAAKPNASALSNMLKELENSPFPHWWKDSHWCWCEEIKANKHIIKEFTAGSHSKDYMDKFYDNILVDYFGREVKYEELMKELNLLI
jgi:hypothetical protein